jgi:hypothetical protein
MVSIDIRKAFDLINHKILLQKLKAYGCDRKSLKWFKSYLRDRHNFVISNKRISKILHKNLSVPQGGCLSALLFIIFMNDIFELSLNGELFLFADDLTLIVFEKNYSELERNTNEDLRKISQWFNKNRLVPNLEKSNFMLMGCPLKSTTININFNGNDLNRVYETKLLGVIFDHDLRFDEHIHKLCISISIKVSFLSRLRYFLPEHTLNFIYKSLVLPLIDYCDIVYGFTYETHLNILKIQQNIAARIITFSHRRESFDNLSLRLKWSSLENRFKFHATKYIYKATNGLASINSMDFFQSKPKINKRLGEDNKTLSLPKAKYNFLTNSIFYNGVKLWNELPFEVRVCTSLKLFISKDKEFYKIL